MRARYQVRRRTTARGQCSVQANRRRAGRGRVLAGASRTRCVFEGSDRGTQRPAVAGIQAAEEQSRCVRQRLHQTQTAPLWRRKASRTGPAVRVRRPVTKVATLRHAAQAAAMVDRQQYRVRLGLVDLRIRIERFLHGLSEVCGDDLDRQAVAQPRRNQERLQEIRRCSAHQCRAGSPSVTATARGRAVDRAPWRARGPDRGRGVHRQTVAVGVPDRGPRQSSIARRRARRSAPARGSQGNSARLRREVDMERRRAWPQARFAILPTLVKVSISSIVKLTPKVSSSAADEPDMTEAVPHLQTLRVELIGELELLVLENLAKPCCNLARCVSNSWACFCDGGLAPRRQSLRDRPANFCNVACNPRSLPVRTACPWA